MNKPICKECEKEGKKYSVTDSGLGTTTLMAFTLGYWDEAGKYHSNQNPNTTTRSYSCSNGHYWSESS